MLPWSCLEEHVDLEECLPVCFIIPPPPNARQVTLLLNTTLSLGVWRK